jgi:hypothetical protein
MNLCEYVKLNMENMELNYISILFYRHFRSCHIVNEMCLMLCENLSNIKDKAKQETR